MEGRRLSHGQKQWLEIGMLIAQDPKLLLVDEPAAGMTDEETHKTGRTALSLAGKHSIIVIEHDMTFVRQIARKVTVLHQGTVLCEGTVDEVQNNERVIEVYLGRKKKDGALMLELAGITVSYEGSRILRGVNLARARPQSGLPHGPQRRRQNHHAQIHHRPGENRRRHDQIGGKELAGLPPDDAPAHGSGYVPQGRDIFPQLTVWENLKISLVIHGAKANGELDRVLELFPVLKEMLQRKGGVLSGGQQQQLAIARALLTEPFAAAAGRADRGHSAQYH
jgi:ABC-type uncharacterized transport system ATPase subunit